MSSCTRLQLHLLLRPVCSHFASLIEALQKNSSNRAFILVKVNWRKRGTEIEQAQAALSNRQVTEGRHIHREHRCALLRAGGGDVLAALSPGLSAAGNTTIRC